MYRCLLFVLLGVASANAAEKSWVFSPPRRPGVPLISNPGSEVRNPIDAFLLAKLQLKGLSLSPEADRATLLRRVSHDLTGLPPTLQELEATLHDPSPDWYERVVDRLLASPAFGERWAQHWLDLVRYAESDGFKEDAHRPAAHRYRDWVIGALNSNLPYDRFVQQQLAGDELEPDNPEALIATGFLRLYPDEYNAANLEQRWQEILDDITDTTGVAFLGLTVGCARCHDHKFDPTSQKDYFALQSFFAPLLPRDDLLALNPDSRRRYEQERVTWEKKTKQIREEIDRLLAQPRANARAYTLGRFGADIQEAVKTPVARRTPYQEQIAALTEKQLRRAENDAEKKLPADKKKRLEELRGQLAAIPAPTLPEPVLAVSDVGPTAPPTHRLMGGNWRNPREKIEPAFPEFLGKLSPERGLSRAPSSTGRRAALARWITRPDHPLTARVIVNRLWQHHFGVGIVPTSGDFGAQGEPASHPELLDWLACELVSRDWSLKEIHRLMVTSAAYRQSSRIDPASEAHRRALAADSENKLLWHARRRRLEGEALRDTLLSLSGELNRRAFGSSSRPRLPEDLSKYGWKPDPLEADQHRRSVYVLARRNLRYPLFEVFDQPDLHNTCSRRMQTTTAPQSLLLLNGELTRERSRKWADLLLARHGEDLEQLTASAYRMAWSRTASQEEVRLAIDFIHRQSSRLRSQNATFKDPLPRAIADFCHAVMNSNELLFVD